jgi:hypothetical protein
MSKAESIATTTERPTRFLKWYFPRLNLLADIRRCNRGIKQGVKTLVCFCLPLETYHTRLSSITRIIIDAELFEFSEKIIDRDSTVVTCRIIGMSNLVKKSQEFPDFKDSESGVIVLSCNSHY